MRVCTTAWDAYVLLRICNPMRHIPALHVRPLQKYFIPSGSLILEMGCCNPTKVGSGAFKKEQPTAPAVVRTPSTADSQKTRHRLDPLAHLFPDGKHHLRWIGVNGRPFTCPTPSRIVTRQLAATPFITSVPPSGQCTSMSAVFSVPKPKCRRGSFADI